MKKFDKRVDVDVTTGMPTPDALTTMVAVFSQHPEFTAESIMSVDIRNAFLQSPMTTPVAVVAPRALDSRLFTDVPEFAEMTAEFEELQATMFGANGLADAVQAIYGTREAPRCFEKAWIALMDRLGFVRSRLYAGVYLRYHPVTWPDRALAIYPHTQAELPSLDYNLRTCCPLLDAAIYAHVDDIVGMKCPTAKPLLLEIAKHMETKAPPEVPSYLLGYDFDVTDERVIIYQQTHADDVKVTLAKGAKPSKPLPDSITKDYLTSGSVSAA